MDPSPTLQLPASRTEPGQAWAPAPVHRRPEALFLIISHTHRFLFFAVPRTGSRSIRTALRGHLGNEDQEQSDWRVRRRLTFPEVAALGHGHIEVRRIRRLLRVESWDGYFKFAFVRNPLDRFVSAAFHRNRRSALFRKRPRAGMGLLLRSPGLMADLYFRPQHDFLTDADGRLALDFVGRFEHLQRDYAEVCRRLGLPVESLPHVNPSDHGPPAEYYDDLLRTEVAGHYDRDLRLFGYGPHETGRHGGSLQSLDR